MTSAIILHFCNYYITCRKNNQILMFSISFSDLIAPVTTFYTIALKVLPRIKTNMIELLNLWIQPQQPNQQAMFFSMYLVQNAQNQNIERFVIIPPDNFQDEGNCFLIFYLFRQTLIMSKKMKKILNATIGLWTSLSPLILSFENLIVFSE